MSRGDNCLATSHTLIVHLFNWRLERIEQPLCTNLHLMLLEGPTMVTIAIVPKMPITIQHGFCHYF